MANEREKITDCILAVLSASTTPLKARELADALCSQGRCVTKTEVNSLLYGELSKGGVVAQDGEYQWFIADQSGALATHEQIPGSQAKNGLVPSGTNDEASLAPQECRRARRVLQVLRSGTTSCRSAKALSVGTARIEKEVYARTDSLLRNGTKGEMVVIAADWGFGKSHMRMLLSNHLSEQAIPFVHECIDARAGSLSHIHRAVPRWLERIQFGRTVGLRDALNNGTLSTESALEFATKNYGDFAFGLRAALGGAEWGWLRALGHFYRSPDYPYQHLKSWAIVESAATFLNKMSRGGLVLLLDEAENIDKQYDIRGRRKSYEMLGRMTRHPHILPVVFVTDRLLYQVEEDYQHGIREGWSNWSSEAKWFVGHFRGLEPLRPPRLTDKLAEELVKSIGALYRAAYPICSPFSPEKILEHWRRTPTRSTRLLVRLTVNQLDLLSQHGIA